MSNKKVTKQNQIEKVKAKDVSPLIVHKERNDSIRLNKYISEKGICSRRAADQMILAKRVTVNSTLANIGTKIYSDDIVKLDGKRLLNLEDKIYLVLNKPKGIICTTELNVKDNIIEFINYPKRIFPIGRLDKESEGLIFLTNDGDIVNKILRAGNFHEKEYIVTVDKKISDEFLNRMSKGVMILDTITKPCKVFKETNRTFRIILTQGLNRQIRRMCAYFGYNVLKLKRIRIMNVRLENLPTGSWRHLTREELKQINNLISTSIKTEEA
jgi:23S rRNA pseudouridine2604 synthase